MFKKCARNYLIQSLVLALTITLPAIAKLEKHTIVPYVVSFNLTATEKVYITPAEPKIYDDFLQYGLKLEDEAWDNAAGLGLMLITNRFLRA